MTVMVPPGSSASESRGTGAVLAGYERLRELPRPLLDAIRTELGPSFVNDQQRTFFDSKAPELLYSGAFRAGKSRIGCEKAYWLAKRYPGIPIGIFRKTANSLAASTERTLLHDVIPRGAIVKSNRTERWYELANGSRIWLFGLDPDPVTGLPSKVGSVELGWAFIDEAAEVTEADWIMVKGRLSWPGIAWHQIAAATNPARPTHWLKQHFTPPTEDRVYLHARTFDNTMLPQDYIDQAHKMAGGYSKSRYILGEWVAPADGALWTPDLIPHGKAPVIYPKGIETPDFARIVVAVDPAVTSTVNSDETGIVICALGNDGRGYVIDDRSIKASPAEWARRAVAAYHETGADRIVAEANNGGDLVSTVISAVDDKVPVTLVHAARGKRTRAEPIAALYEQGRVTHTHDFPELEDQMCLAADTGVLTSRGYVPIAEVRMGELVLTRAGFRTVLWSGQTGVRETIRVKTRDGILTCTGTHPIYVNGRGFVPAGDLRLGDELLTWHDNPFAHSSNSTERGTSWIVTATTRRLEAEAAGSTTVHSGSVTTAQSRRVGTSTIGTTRGATTTSGTSSPSRHHSTSVSTARQGLGSSHRQSSRPSGVQSGRSNSRPFTFAPYVGSSSGRAGLGLPTARPDAGSVIALERGPAQPVYNLTVHEQPEFYANGYLVHNCSYTGAPGEDSPDRMDALVWGLSELFNVKVDDKTWGAGVWGS